MSDKAFATNVSTQKLSVLVIGLGLIGGSFAAALKRSGVCQTLIGYDRNQESLVKARSLGIIDQAAESLAVGVKQADVVMLSVPMLATQRLPTRNF